MGGCPKPQKQSAEERFVRAVATKESAEVMELLDVRIRDDVDEPILAAWINAIRDHLGPLVEYEPTGTEIIEGDNPDEWFTRSRGRAEFRDGLADVIIDLLDGRIVGFSIESPLMPEDWFQGPADTAFYRRRGRDLLAHIVSDYPGRAYPLLGEGFKQTVTPDDLARATATEPLTRGQLESITYSSESFGRAGGGVYLTIYYDLVCEKGTSRGAVRYRFVDLKGHIVKFSPGALRPRAVQR
jgi:hypothetical protein